MSFVTKWMSVSLSISKEVFEGWFSRERSFEVAEIAKCAVIGSVPNGRRY
jgi:hypothetical protein